MSESLELIKLVQEKCMNRTALLISNTYVNLHLPEEGCIVYLLELQIGYAAGGRAGGYGQRTVESIHKFTYKGGRWSKTLTMQRDDIPEQLVPPFHATAMPITSLQGSEVIVLGAIDRELIMEYDRLIGS